MRNVSASAARGWWIGSALSTVLAGCGGATDPTRVPAGPEEPFPVADSVPLPDLRVPAVFTTRVVLTLEDPRSGQRRVRGCSGSLVLHRQVGQLVEGAFAIHGSPGCSAADSGTVAGRVLPFGDLVLELQVRGGAPNELPANAGCVYTGPARRFEGAVNDKRFVVVSSHRVSCAAPAGGAHDLRVRIAGERVFTRLDPARAGAGTRLRSH